MCLAVPGKLIEIQDGSDDVTGDVGIVDFQGSRIELSLAFVPDAKVGDWLLVHAGYAINKLDAEEAREVWEMLQADEAYRELMPEELKAGGPA